MRSWTFLECPHLFGTVCMQISITMFYHNVCNIVRLCVRPPSPPFVGCFAQTMEGVALHSVILATFSFWKTPTRRYEREHPKCARAHQTHERYTSSILSMLKSVISNLIRHCIFLSNHKHEWYKNLVSNIKKFHKSRPLIVFLDGSITISLLYFYR